MGLDRKTLMLDFIVLLVNSIFLLRAYAYQGGPYEPVVMPPPDATLSHETNSSYEAWRQIFDKLNLGNATIGYAHQGQWTMPKTCRLHPCGYVNKQGFLDTCYTYVFSPQTSLDEQFIDHRCLNVRDMPTSNCEQDYRAGVICNSRGEIIIIALSFFDFKLPLVMLPAEIGSLPKLQQLWLIGGNFSNDIPPTIANLKELTMVNFAFNDFSYPLEPSVRALCIQKPMFGMIPSLKIPALQDTASCTAFGGFDAVSFSYPCICRILSC